MRYLPRFLCLALLLQVAHPVSATFHNGQVPGTFYFYDYHLDPYTDDPNNQACVSQAQPLECQGKVELFTWGTGGRCARYTPEKVGDSISFGIRVQSVEANRVLAVKTSRANFNNEGIYQLLVNDQPTGEPHDCFGREEWNHGQFPIQPGNYKITYRYVSKNPKSTGSVLNLNWIEFG